MLGASGDIVYRTFTIAGVNLSAALVYVDGLAENPGINEFILRPLMQRGLHLQRALKQPPVPPLPVEEGAAAHPFLRHLQQLLVINTATAERTVFTHVVDDILSGSTGDGLVGASIGVGVLAFPRIIVNRAGTGAPLAVLLGAVPGTLAWLASVRLARRCPGQTPVEYAPRLLTRPLGWLYGATLAVFLIVITALAIREFGEVVKTAVLRNTPLEATIIVLLLTTAYFVRYDLQVFARVFEVFFPLMLVPLTLIGLLSLKNARLYYLLPVTGPNWGVVQGAALAGVGYVAYVIGSFLLPSLHRPKAAVSAGIWGMGLSLFVYMLVVCATLAVFGPE